MGNQSSNSKRIGYPNQQLKLKVNDKLDPIPCPYAVSKPNYQSLHNDPQFKDFLMENLYSNPFISSILQNSFDESIVMEGIPYFMAINREVRTDYNNDVKKFQDFIISGLQCSLPTTMQICEKDLEFHKNPRCSPFLRALQCRLAVIRDLESTILLERKMISEKSLSQRMTTTSLNSSDHPNLSFIYPLMISGMSLIKIIPNILQMTPPSVDVEQFLQPFMFLTKQYRLVPDLALFKCWSPAPRPPLKRLLIDRHMISSNTGEPLKAVNDTQHQYWTCPSKGGVLTVTFDRPTSVASVNIAWAPLQPASSSSLTCSAPRKLHVLVRRFPGSPLELLSTIDVDEERKRTRSWVHEYKIGGCETIFALHLQPEGLSQFNQSTSDPIKVYNISVFSEDSDATWVNTMSLVQDYQQILYTFHNFDCLEVDMYSTLFTLPRVTGSLLSLLDLLLHFDDLNASLKLRSDVQRFFSVWTSIHHLLAAVQKTHCLLQEGIMSSITSQESTKNLTKEITFDENAKSPDMIISEEGRLITCNSGGNSYGLIDCEMENGVWEWEITITRDNHGDETSCLGVARRPVTNCNYDTTSDMWLIRCYNGDTYHCGRLPKKRSIPQIHPNDICKFTFDCDTRTLSLMVNDIDIGVIFDNLDSGISPAVSFYGSGKSIKLLSIKQIRNTNCLDGINLADLSTIPDTPSVEHLMTSKFDIVAEILHRISELVKLHLVIFGADKTKGNLESTLEYPFAIQVCYEVFESILALLQKSYQSNDIRTMISLLIILKGQFACLTRADVDPSVAGFGISGLHTNSNNVLHLGHSLLSSLMNHSDSQLKIVAAETFSQGIQFFLPDTSQKLKFTVDTVANIYPLHSSESELAQFIVLKTMIKKLAHCGEVLKMINSFYRLPNDENLVPRLINFCLQLTVDITLLDSNGTSSLLNSNDFRESLYKLISTYQEQLLVDIISEDPPHGALFLCTDYFKNLCLKITLNNKLELFNPTVQDQFRKSLIGRHFFPAIHGLCLSLHHLDLIKNLSSSLIRTFEKLSNITSKSLSCQSAHKLFSKACRRIQQKPIVVVEEVNGWRQIKAQFEEPQPDFSVTEDGMVYTSIHSSNTCAIVNCGFSGQCKAAWEFVLESDTLDDECAVFGAAHLPLANRSYSASPNLYMRRAYNGHLYHRGRSVPSSLGKIHPGDIVRIEYDGRAETLSFSINGNELETCFTNVVGEIYPCCGSYRNNVRIRLLKVEVFGATSVADEDDSRAPDIVKWITESPFQNPKDPSILSFSKDLPKQQEGLEWLTGRGDRGASEGVHCWNFEILENSNQPLAFGIVFGESISSDLPLAGSSDDSQPPIVHAPILNKGNSEEVIHGLLSCDVDDFMEGDFQDSFELNDEDPESFAGGALVNNSTPYDLTLSSTDFPALDFPPCPTLSRTSTPADSPLPVQYTRRRSSLSSVNFNFSSSNHRRAVSPVAEAKKKQLRQNVESVAWHSDGSLWVNGKKRSESFGAAFLPFQKMTVVGIQVDRNIGTVSFYVNGMFVGIAFGPLSMSPCVSYMFPSTSSKSSSSKRDLSICYPAASISSRSQTLRIVASGFHGSVSFPVVLLVQRTLASIIGRILSTLIEGPQIDQNEVQLSHWMKSPLLLGGIDQMELKIDDWSDSWNNMWRDSNQPNDGVKLSTRKDIPLADDEKHSLLSVLDEKKFLKYLSLAWSDGFLTPSQRDVCITFMEWLNSTQPELEPLKTTLLRSGTYNFPRCEFPLLSCMLKHGMLVQEAQNICSLIESHNVSTIAELPSPSQSMVALANKIKQLRWHLRRQRQHLMNLNSDIQESKFDQFLDGAPSIPPQSNTIKWINISSSISCRNTESSCIVRVHSIGVNFRDKQVCIQLNITCSEDDMQSPESSLMVINGVPLSFDSFSILESKSQLSPKSEVTRQMIFKFDTLELSPSILKSSDITFRYGNHQFSPIVLLSPDIGSLCSTESKVEDLDDANVNTQMTFDQYCSTIADKANFLLKFLPSTSSNSGSSREDKDLSASKLASWRSDDSNDKWRSVAGVLRVQKKIRREHSEIEYSASENTNSLEEMIPDLETNSDNEDLDCSSYSQKALQECLLFVLSDTAPSSLATLTDVIEKRCRRGILRSFGMDALTTVLQLNSVSSDPISISEILYFLKSSLMSECSLGIDEEGHQKVAPAAHYFSSLQGCSQTMLDSVRNSFRHLYTTLSDLLLQFLNIWKGSIPPSCFQDTHSLLKAVIVLLTCWSLYFPPSDHQFLLESPLLQTLFEITSFSVYESAVSKWFSAAENYLKIFSQYGKHLPEYSNIVRNWKPWSSSYVHKALRFGQLSCRSLLFHLYQIPSGLLSVEDKIILEFPIEKSFKELCLHYDVSSLSLLHENILGLFRNREQKRQKQFEKAQAAYLEGRLLEEQAEKKRLRDAGVPLFDPSNQSSDIFMEDADQVAGVRNFQSSSKVASTYVELQYNLSIPQIDRTGNYFEVTIIKCGMKDIGIGLAVLGVFPVTGEMPGWEPHSYGYHGDDGTKFGTGSTPGKWPVWDDGDVIGCGIDFSRRSIFYTRNGVLLGDGFRNVLDDNLMPVISFHSPNILQKVRINFGQSEFTYKGSEIVPNAAARRVFEQHLTKASLVQSIEPATSSKEEYVFRLSESELKKALSAYGLSTHGVRSELEIRLLGAYENQFHLFQSRDGDDSKEDIYLEDKIHFYEKEYNLAHNEVTEATIHLEELTNLRNFCGSFLRYLLNSSCICEDDQKGSCSQLAKPITENYLSEIHVGAKYLVEASKNLHNKYLIVATPPVGKSLDHSSTQLELLEIHEVEYFLGKIIFSLYSLISYSATIKDLICTEIEVFYLLMQVGSPRMRRMILNIFLICLPPMLPSMVDRLINVSPVLSPVSRSRDLPDTILRTLLVIISDSIAPPSTNSQSNRNLVNHHVPLGYGRLLLNLGDHCVTLFRRLFEAPNWTEVVSCCLTNIFRSAGEVINKFVDNNSLSNDELDLLNVAAAACTTLSGLEVIRPGAKVVRNDGKFFSVVSIQEGSQRATICSGNIYHETEIVPLHSIRSVLPPLSLDLLTLSQPLLEEYLSLSSKVLQFFRVNSKVCFEANDNSTAQFTIFRLISLLSTSFAKLYDNFPTSFVNQLSPDLITCLVQVSLDPIMLEFSPTIQDLSIMWNFIQSRNLETSHGSLMDTTQETVLSTDPSPRTIDDSHGLSLDYPPSVIIYSQNTLQERKKVADEIALQLDLPSEICLKRLEYFAGNVVSTVESLKKYSSPENFQPLPLPQTTTISDENVMRYIDYPSDSDHPTVDTSGRTLRVPDICNLLRLAGTNEDIKLKRGSLIVPSVDDGAFEILPASLYVYISDFETNDMITQYCDDELGIAFYSNLSRSDTSLVTALYNCQIQKFPQLGHSIDIAIAQVRFRQLALELVIDQKILLEEPHLQEQILLLLKFNLRNESKLYHTRSVDYLSHVCAVHDSTPSGEFNINELLIQDLKRNLLQLLESNPNEFPGLNSSEFYECESTHPIQFGGENCGVFDIPESWKGALILVDSRSSTDDPVNSLSFYSSQEDFQNVKPIKKFWGKSGFEKSNFQSFLVPASTSSILSYRFSAAPLESKISIQESLNVDDLHTFIGSCRISDGFWFFEVKILFHVAKARVGLLQTEQLPHGFILSIDEESNLYCGSQRVQCTSLGRWQSGDIISCMVSRNSQKVTTTFGRNGMWADPLDYYLATSEIVFFPSYQVENSQFVEMNCGESSFTFPPTSPECKSLMECYQTFLENRYSSNWGYFFQVRPIGNLCCLVARDFELILKAQVDDGAESSYLYFWRAKRVSGYKNCGDIITRDSRPPRGCILVASDHCKPIKRYSKVFSSSKHNLTIWKPLPIEGYGCLGDIVTVGTSKPNASACSCIPLSFLQKCEVVHCLMKSKSKTSKGHQIASIWEISSHMGHFFGSPTERRDFIRKNSDGQTCPAISYTFKINYLSIILGEWIHERDIIHNKPSLQWSLYLCQYFLNNLSTHHYFINEEIFHLLIKYLCSKNSPNNISILSILIQIIRISIKKHYSIGINLISQTCKMIINSIYVKYKNEKYSFLNNYGVFQLINFVSEAINDIRLFKTPILPISFPPPSPPLVNSNYSIFTYPALEERDRATLDLTSMSWYQLLVPDHIRETYRQISLSQLDTILSNKPQMLRQLREIRLFLTSLDRLNNSQNDLEADYLPMELILSTWNKYMKGTAYDESSHPYNVNEKQTYRKEYSFPGAKTISLCFDPRCHLHENSSLKISNGQNLLMIIDSTSIQQYLMTATVITGSQVIIEFDVNSLNEESNSTCSSSVVDMDEYWGWGIVISAEGPIFEGTSIVIDLDKQQEKLPDLLPERSTGLNENEFSLIKDRGQYLDKFTFGIPFCHQTKLSIVSSQSSSTDSQRKEFAIEMIMPDGTSRLHILREDTPVIIDSNSLNFVLYSLDLIAPLTEQTVIEPSQKSEIIPELESLKSIPTVPPPHPPTTWNCPLCTFCNLISSTRCEMCGTENPHRVSSNDDDGENIIEAQENNPATPADFAVWMCGQCTFMNQMDTLRCDMCGFNRSREIPRIGSSPDSLFDEIPQVRPAAAVDQTQISETVSDDDESENNQISHSILPNIPELSNLSLSSNHQPEPANTSLLPSLDESPQYQVVVPSDGPTPSTHKEGRINQFTLNIDGIFTPTEKFESCLNQAILYERWTPLDLCNLMMKWSTEADEILLDTMNQELDSEKLLTQHPFQWIISLKQLLHLTLTLPNPFTLLDIQSRVMLINAFNTSLKYLLPIIDISNPDPLSLGYLIRKLNRYVLLNVKLPILYKSIELTMASGTGLPAHLNLDNFKTTLSKDKMEKDPHNANNCFIQAFHQLNKFDSKIFRYIFNSDRVFQIHFEGESGIDAGGVFREGITRIVEDLFDINHFTLMILCPNGQHSVYLNMDKYLPNPQHTSPLALQMMEFVGKLMGMSLRAKLALPFNFPPIIWKKLLKESVNADDLRAFDAITWSLLNSLQYCENDGIINQQLFEEKYEDKLRFTYTGCDGVEKELFLGGKDVIVTYDRRHEYCQQVLDKRLNECNEQINAIYKGLESVIEIRVLYLFSWQQLEILVGGNPVFDIETWKSHTESSLHPKTLELFWKVIESLTPKEQEGFVRFAWGRSRLPPAKEFTVKMKLTPRGSEKLPVAHTCFFSIEIPDYKTEDEMRHGILTAIHFGASGVLIG